MKTMAHPSKTLNFPFVVRKMISEVYYYHPNAQNRRLKNFQKSSPCPVGRLDLAEFGRMVFGRDRFQKCAYFGLIPRTV